MTFFRIRCRRISYAGSFLPYHPVWFSRRRPMNKVVVQRMRLKVDACASVIMIIAGGASVTRRIPAFTDRPGTVSTPPGVPHGRTFSMRGSCSTCVQYRHSTRCDRGAGTMDRVQPAKAFPRVCAASIMICHFGASSPSPNGSRMGIGTI